MAHFNLEACAENFSLQKETLFAAFVNIWSRKVLWQIDATATRSVHNSNFLQWMWTGIFANESDCDAIPGIVADKNHFFSALCQASWATSELLKLFDPTKYVDSTQEDGDQPLTETVKNEIETLRPVTAWLKFGALYKTLKVNWWMNRSSASFYFASFCKWIKVIEENAVVIYFLFFCWNFNSLLIIE